MIRSRNAPAELQDSYLPIQVQQGVLLQRQRRKKYGERAL